jgi:hypothetical protein
MNRIWKVPPKSNNPAQPEGEINVIHYIVKGFAVIAAVLFLSVTVLEVTAHARAGGGRSSGSRSYSRPAPSYSQQGQPRQQYAPAPGPMQQQAGGGFMRNMAGGLAGGMLGSMLFSSLAGAGGGMGSGTGGGGIGLFEIILLAGGGYLLYRYLQKKRTANAVNPYERR